MTEEIRKSFSGLMNATVVVDEMMDGRKAYNVAFMNDSGVVVATLAAESKGHAQTIADVINEASFIQFHA